MLTVRRLFKAYSTSTGVSAAVRGVDLEVPEGRFLSLLGPSGCGKTTTLRCIAGLERPDSGEIRIGGALVTAPALDIHLPAHARDIGMVFQSYAIWPHLDVFGNVAYPLQVRRPRPASAEITDRVMETLVLVGLADLARRSATTLSGGEQQRVALARAIVRRPRLLLLDEPLSNLDARLREQMQHEINELIRRLGITTLAVTHDQDEALAMADQVAVMCEGRIVQCAAPADLYAQPATSFVASFLGRGSVIPGTISAVHDDGSGLVAVEGQTGRLRVRVPAECRNGERIELALRSEDIALVRTAAGGEENVLAGIVERLSFRGGSLECRVRVAETVVRTIVAAGDEVKIGDEVWLVVDPARIVVFRQERPT